MKQALFLGALVFTVLFGIYGVVTVYDTNMTAGRMRETPAVRPYEKPLLVMDKGIVPFFEKSEALMRLKSPALPERTAPLPDEPTPVEAGLIAYNRYCIHCHGKDLDGMGTVGQSFSPLPRDLKGPEVKALDDGALFNIISYGGKRSPALATTMSVQSRLAVIAYLRSQQQKVR